MERTGWWFKIDKIFLNLNHHPVWPGGAMARPPNPRYGRNARCDGEKWLNCGKMVLMSDAFTSNHRASVAAY